MRKNNAIYFIFLLFPIALSAQLRLNVAGNAAILGNLAIGDPEGTITGIDMLSGLNDLRFSANDGTTEHMRLTNIGYLGIGTPSPNFRLEVYGETQTVLGLTNTSTGGRAWGLYSLGASNGEGAGNFMIRDETSGKNRIFIDTDGDVGIGTITPGPLLDVNNTEGSTTAISGTSSIAGDYTRGIYGASELSTVRGIGVEASASGLTGQQSGLEATSTGGGSAVRIGAIGRVSGAGNSGPQYGTYGWILSTGATNTRTAVYGLLSGDGTGTDYAGYFNGDVTVTGVFDNPSDEKLKKDIKSLDKAMDQIMALRPVRYQFRTQEYPQMNLAEGMQMGFIAQEVERVFPELIKDNAQAEVPGGVDENGAMTDFYPAVNYKGLNYQGLIPVLTRAAQEQQEELEKLETSLAERDRLIASLEDRLAHLEQVVEKLAGANTGSAQTIPVTSADLRQNQPNPFTETTLIKYAIPDKVNQAELRITDVNGRLLKTIAIDQRGEGMTRLQAQSLNAGTYFYTLVLDGRALESRKMVLTK